MLLKSEVPSTRALHQPTVLKLESISKRYARIGPNTLEAVNLQLYQGEILSLLGPSGCGKTTLLRLIAGFEQPQQGTIELAERTVCAPGKWTVPEQRGVGVVFQDYALFPHLNVRENVRFGLKSLARRGCLSKLDLADRAQAAIALVGLSGFEQRYSHELSGGQQQRVALARALAPRPALILLDEPFSNLDVQVRLYLRQEVRDILKSIGASGIFVTHDQEEALAISDRMAVMRQGQIEQVGTPEEIYRQPASRFVAEFVTQANFIPTQRRGQIWETEVGQFEISPNPAASADCGELMIRQEDLRLELDEQAPLLVSDRHFLGREYKYCLKTPSERTLHARTAARLPVGCRVRVAVTPRNLRFFPTGQAGAYPKMSAA
ncbi:MAG: ABC transporter ATP-binding protein [Leptolyngbyaceae cyanobacterium SM1_1_3]|nr:ABC transporter ATP-binding protein [Leptolyngbyaceae cyanobacterium SM1_1_3]NJN01495.1 ABC transporter ATP-binding protein [Leptolyngbyaceae cyanobacterium RM1_1_2]NJO08691.1 ABC transporter ATP-binding protein [Leptolyngbyaceae cyanobacterium SL_1_1]